MTAEELLKETVSETMLDTAECFYDRGILPLSFFWNRYGLVESEGVLCYIERI